MLENKIFSLKTFKIIFILFLALLSNQALAQKIKIVQFSDIHLDTINQDREVRKFGQSADMYKKAIIKTNAIKPNIVVISGDMVNRPKESEFDAFLNISRGFGTRYYPSLGNHDVGVGGGLSKEMIINKLNASCPWLNLTKPYYYSIQGEYIFIFMDGTTDKQITSTGYFTDEVLNFLDKTLTDYKYKKAIIVQHFPLMPPFKSSSHEIINKEDYFNVIEQHKNVILVLSGHYHASNAVERKNVLYITTPSMIEYPHAFRYLIVNSDKNNIIISSKLILDDEQNAHEEKQGVIGKLKLGLNSDNNFTIKLKNNVPQETFTDVIDKLLPVNFQNKN